MIDTCENNNYCLEQNCFYKDESLKIEKSENLDESLYNKIFSSCFDSETDLHTIESEKDISDANKSEESTVEIDIEDDISDTDYNLFI